MELKPYQQQVINGLSLFLEYVQALQPFSGTAIEPYKNGFDSL